ncbi:MAG: ABC transporter permease [Chloroflexota bacterium]
MFQTIIHIAANYLKRTYSSPAVLIFQLLMPLLFTFLIGQAIGGQGGSGSSSTTVEWTLPVVNEDEGVFGDTLAEILDNDPAIEVVLMDLDTAVSLVESEEHRAAVRIPANFSSDLLSETEPVIDFYSNPEDAAVVQPIEQVVIGGMSQLYGFVAVANVSITVANETIEIPNEAEYFETAVGLAQEKWEIPPTALQVNEDEIIVDSSIPTGINQSSPGMMAMFATFGMIGGAAAMVQEREEGTLRRLVVMPIRKGSIILGFMLGILLTGLVQMAILIIAGDLFFGVAWGNSPFALALVSLAFALAITSLGMFMAALVRTAAQINGMSTLIVLSIAALGGAWWPLDIVPSWMQVVGRFSPISWAMDGFHDVITRGLGLTAVLPEVGMLLIFTAVFLLIGISRFQYE